VTTGGVSGKAYIGGGGTGSRGRGCLIRRGKGFWQRTQQWQGRGSMMLEDF
jgi:hypothetical protein